MGEKELAKGTARSCMKEERDGCAEGCWRPKGNGVLSKVQQKGQAWAERKTDRRW